MRVTNGVLRHWEMNRVRCLLLPTILVLAAMVVQPIHAEGALQVSAAAAFAGSYGLEVTVGSACTDSNDISLTGSVQGTYQACRSIVAADGEVVSPGATFVAGQYVGLDQPFTVTGQPFSASTDWSLNPFAYLEDNSPESETSYAADFALRLDGLTLGLNDQLKHLVGYSSDGTEQFRIILTRLATNDLIILSARENSGSYIETTPGQEIVVPNGWNEIGLVWQTGASNGSLQLSLNGVVAGSLTSLTNSASRIDFVRWGGIDGNVYSTSGKLELDEFSSAP